MTSTVNPKKTWFYLFPRVLDQPFCVDQPLRISFKNTRFASFFTSFASKTCENIRKWGKTDILISVWSAQHPNVGQIIQQIPVIQCWQICWILGKTKRQSNFEFEISKALKFIHIKAHNLYLSCFGSVFKLAKKSKGQELLLITNLLF